MNVEVFKKLKPEYKNIEGEQLWDAMTNYMLLQQQSSEIIKPIMPIWKTHTFRWLYYRQIPNLMFGNISTDKYTSNKRCKECRWGVNTRMGFLLFNEDKTSSYHSYCPHCGKEYHEELNTNFTYKLYKVGKLISDIFWMILDRLHLVRSSTIGRYDMFGDEARYVKSWGFNIETGETSMILKNRKWWEYVLIERRIHNF